MESFDSTKTSLYQILKDVDSGKIQLPDFQRGWVWDDNRIKALLASVAKSFPIGAIMLLETGNETVKFKTKPIEGSSNGYGVKPEMLVLDGQQRLTSLYQAIITNKPVVTRNPKGYEIKRWYYIDMKKAVDTNTDLEEAIFSINENKIITSNIGRDVVLDLSKQEYEFKNLMYPIWLVDECDDWYMKYQEYYDYDRDMIIFWNNFNNKIIRSIDKYMLPLIIMRKENPKEAVCQVFEKVNTGGVSLTVFELLTASFASEEYDLKTDWENIKKLFKEFKVLYNTQNTDIIQAITLFSTYQKRKASIGKVSDNDLPAISAKRKEMLNLSLAEYLNAKDFVVKGFIKASKLLIEQGIFHARDLPYSTQLVPMAATLAVLGDKIDNVGKKNKLMRWYWCGVFGELYGSANESRYALDLPQLVDWIQENGPEPKTIFDASFTPSRLHTLRTRNSAAYKGIYAILLMEGIKDWLSATSIDLSSYFSESIDIHHIFPVAWCEKPENKIPRADYDSIINKTALSGRTNRIVSGDAPSKYLERLNKRAGVDKEVFNLIINGHLIRPELLYSDDFKAFFNDRKEQLLKKIEETMGKAIPRDQMAEEEEVFIEPDYIDEDA